MQSVSTGVGRNTTRRSRTFTDAHLQRLDEAAGQYLIECYRLGTAARVSEFAVRLGRNPDYLSRTAGAIVGISLRNFLRAKQLAYAEQLLRITSLKVREIALLAGFGTTSTFYRCFRALHGIPPGAFREVMKCEAIPQC